MGDGDTRLGLFGWETLLVALLVGNMDLFGEIETAS